MNSNPETRALRIELARARYMRTLYALKAAEDKADRANLRAVRAGVKLANARARANRASFRVFNLCSKA